MADKKRATKVIYHGACPDGYSAYMAFHLNFPDTQVTAIAASNGDPAPLEQIEPDDTVYIVDYSLDPADLTKVADITGKPVTVLDHHASIYDTFTEIDTPWKVKKNPEQTKLVATLEHNQIPITVNIDKTESGASLAWQYINGPELPLLIQYIKDKDLDINKLPRSKEIAALTISLPEEPNIWTEKIDMRFEELLPEAIAAHRIRQQQIRAIVARAAIVEISGITLPIARCGLRYGSDVAAKLRQKYSTDKAGYFYGAPDGTGYKYNVSRSPDSTWDAKQFAQKLGGGGNPHAAGFSTTTTIQTPHISKT